MLQKLSETSFFQIVMQDTENYSHLSWNVCGLITGRKYSNINSNT